MASATAAVDHVKAALSRYESHVPDSLKSLDRLRFEHLPAVVAGREAPHLDKEELVRLVEWKLKHGKFRPNLLKLAESNSAADVAQTTRDAFIIVGSSNTDDQFGPVEKAMKVLVSMRGIGPATASLLLSYASPSSVPFFSDELFRFAHWHGQSCVPGGVKPAKEGAEWDRPIRYTTKEYHSLFEEVRSLRLKLREAGLQLSTMELEKAAWVFGTERVDVRSWIEELRPVKCSPAEEIQASRKRNRNQFEDGQEDGGKPGPAKSKRGVSAPKLMSADAIVGSGMDSKSGVVRPASRRSKRNRNGRD